LKNKFHGFGQEKLGNNQIYSGKFKNGEKDSYGKIVWPLLDAYFIGLFFRNNIDGEGLHVFGKQDMSKLFYIGMLQTNVYSGFGMLYFRDGSYYIGNFKDGKQHAFGIYKWSDGRSYEGYWWDGEKHGIGRFY